MLANPVAKMNIDALLTCRAMLIYVLRVKEGMEREPAGSIIRALNHFLSYCKGKGYLSEEEIENIRSYHLYKINFLKGLNMGKVNEFERAIYLVNGIIDHIEGVYNKLLDSNKAPPDDETFGDLFEEYERRVIWAFWEKTRDEICASTRELESIRRGE